MRRAAHRRWFSLGFVLCLHIGATSSHAAQCTVSTTGLAFGAYDQFSTLPNDSNGSVQITCDAVIGYTVAVNAGVSGSLNRAMAFGAYRLNYNLFTESTRTVVWGDGSAGSARVSGSGTSAVIPLYGRIPARQNVPAGSYADTLIVTVNY